MQRRSFLAALAATTALPKTAAAADGSPLTRPWVGPYGGVPAFDLVKVADFDPAMSQAMAAELAEVDAIAQSKAKPSFENTIAALERSGKTSQRVGSFYGIWTSTLNTPDMQAVEAALEPRLAAHGDKIVQNPALFARIEAVYKARKALTPEQQRLTWVYWNSFTRAGASLSPAAKTRVAAINQELAGDFTAFSQNQIGRAHV